MNTEYSIKYAGINQWFVLANIFLFLSACNSVNTDKMDPKDKEVFCENASAAGYQTLMRASSSRAYILYVPSTYDGTSPTPLLINFHGFGGCASDFLAELGAGNTGLNAVAETHNFLVAYPQGLERSKGGPEWDPGDNGSPNIEENDVYFVEQLIAEISLNYLIDSTRIYASGFSNGGMMAYGLACSPGNIIAAAGIMSGTMLEGSCNQNEYTAIIHFHGMADEVLPYNGNQDFQSIPQIVDFWLTHNDIPVSSLTTVALNGGDVEMDQYTGGKENTSFALYRINQEYNKAGGHVWFTEAIDGKSPNQILWDFLSTYSLND